MELNGLTLENIKLTDTYREVLEYDFKSSFSWDLNECGNPHRKFAGFYTRSGEPLFESWTVECGLYEIRQVCYEGLNCKRQFVCDDTLFRECQASANPVVVCNPDNLVICGDELVCEQERPIWKKRCNVSEN